MPVVLLDEAAVDCVLGLAEGLAAHNGTSAARKVGAASSYRLMVLFQ